MRKAGFRVKPGKTNKEKGFLTKYPGMPASGKFFAIALALLLAWSSLLHAATTVTHPYIGITAITRTESSPRTVNMHIIEVDLTTPGIAFKLTPQGFGSPQRDTVRQTTLSYLNQEHAQVAVNSHFFLPFPSPDTTAYLVGFAVSNGNVYSPFETPTQSYAIVTNSPAINIDPNNNARIVHADTRYADSKHVLENVIPWNAFAGSAQIITNGVVTIPVYKDATHPDGLLITNGTYSNSNSWYNVANARTIAGLSQDNKTFFIFTVDKAGGSLGMTVGEAANFLVSNYGVYNATNLDGGGSTTLAMQDPVTAIGTILNVSADNPNGRAEGSNLAIFAEPGGSISGTVRNGLGIGIANVSPTAFDMSGNWMSNAITNQDGNYTITGLPTGSYKVLFSAPGGYSTEWYNNKANHDSADPIVVTAPNTTSGIDAVLDQVFGSSLAANFGPQGLWLYRDTAWSMLTGSSPNRMASYESKLVANFSAFGLWKYDGTTWIQLTGNSSVENLLGVSGKLYADYGSLGLWKYDGAWTQLTAANPDNMQANGNNLLANLPGYGLYQYDGKAWTQLTFNDTVESMLGISGKVYADYGSLGLWEYDGSWTQITGSNPDKVQAYDGKLVANFPGYGLYLYDGTTWTQLSSNDSVQDLIGVSSNLYADYGTLGLWKYNGTWTQLSAADPNRLGSYGDKLVANFPGFGLYEYDGSSWTMMTGNSGATDMIAVDLP